LVGNGFDISTLNKFGKGMTTKYEEFYNYYCKLNGENSTNYIIQSMYLAKKQGEENWSDLESHIGEYLNYKSKRSIKKLKRDLFEIQKLFSVFLNSIVTDDVILSVSEYCYTSQVAKKSYENFIVDLSEEKYRDFEFPAFVSNHDRIKFEVINFNYTSLLDNYLYLDQEQFDPNPYRTSHNNAVLELNPNNYSCGKYQFHNPYVHVDYEIHHPHGNQDIPKSLLFGAEINNLQGGKIDEHDVRKMFVKSNVARCEEKYKDLFFGTRLFLIYGCSLGESDSWWWSRVLECVLIEKGEVIIYIYDDEDDENVKNRFIKNSFFESKMLKDFRANYVEAIIYYLKSRIFVIHHSANIKFMQYK